MTIDNNQATRPETNDYQVGRPSRPETSNDQENRLEINNKTKMLSRENAYFISSFLVGILPVKEALNTVLAKTRSYFRPRKQQERDPGSAINENE